MKKLGKSFLMILMLLCMFSYMGVVKAADALKLKDVESDSITAVENLLTGEALSTDDLSKITALQQKYDLYYSYAKIDADLFSKYKSGDDSVSSTIAGKIPAPTKESEITGDTTTWKVLSGTQISYSDPALEYNSENPVGYIVALEAVEKTPSSGTEKKVYDYRNIYQSASTTTLVRYNASDNNNEDTPKENPSEEEQPKEDSDQSEESDTEEKAESNPETGISDMAIYLVPLSIGVGSVLLFKRRYV